MPIAIIPWIIYQLYGNHPKPWSRRKRSSALRAAKWVMGWSRATWFCGISFWAPRWLPARLNRKYGAGCLCNQLYSSKKNCWQLWFLSQNTCWATHAALYIIHQGCSLLGHSKPWLKSFKRGVPSVDSPFFPQHWTHPGAQRPSSTCGLQQRVQRTLLGKDLAPRMRIAESPLSGAVAGQMHGR